MNETVHVDLHVHTRHSRHPSEWLLQRIGASESYTPVETVYKMAKTQGNAFVTITDHNTIDGAVELCRMHPEDCFISTEATAYFPEDGCKVHILCYGITPAQFAAIQQARENIYNLRDYLRQAGIACSVAHARIMLRSVARYVWHSAPRSCRSQTMQSTTASITAEGLRELP